MDDPRLKRTNLGYLEVIDKPTQEDLNTYYADKSCGSAAHRARIQAELLLSN